MSTYLDQGINKVKFKMARNEKPKNYMGFHIHKIWQILKHKKFRFQKGFFILSPNKKEQGLTGGPNKMKINRVGSGTSVRSPKRIDLFNLINTDNGD